MEAKQMTMESRLYCLTNPTYMSQIQCGIQSLHVLGELNVKYRHEKTEAADLLFDWQDNHKTVIVLNGGCAGDLVEIREYLYQDAAALGLPYAHFNEDVYSLGGVITCVGVVVPAYLYGAVEYDVASVAFREGNRPNVPNGPPHLYYEHFNGEINVYSEESVEWKFIKLLKSKRLA